MTNDSSAPKADNEAADKIRTDKMNKILFMAYTLSFKGNKCFHLDALYPVFHFPPVQARKLSFITQYAEESDLLIYSHFSMDESHKRVAGEFDSYN